MTLLTVADRLATRGRNADEAIAAPPRARAAELLDAALRLRAAPARRAARPRRRARARAGHAAGPAARRAAGRDRGGALRGRGRHRRRGGRARAAALATPAPSAAGALAAAQLVGPGARGLLVVEDPPRSDEVVGELHHPAHGAVERPVPLWSNPDACPRPSTRPPPSSSVPSKRHREALPALAQARRARARPRRGPGTCARAPPDVHSTSGCSCAVSSATDPRDHASHRRRIASSWGRAIAPFNRRAVRSDRQRPDDNRRATALAQRHRVGDRPEVDVRGHVGRPVVVVGQLVAR